ncbi:MAG: dTDP-4-dehydrorhamnose 3,5-epimerase [Bacteroidales bacterium]|nr:dTDP-4-dehydrorhamnose 3,5-epimerase [Bacteroidales bacterium]
MNFIKLKIEGLFIIEPKVIGDERGYFCETFKKDLFEQNIGKINFVQENESMSSFGVLRGLHLQKPPYTQAKLVSVPLGKVLDVAVDVRTDSPTFGKYEIVELSDQNKRRFFIPRGFAHGFVVLSDKAIFQYKVDNVYNKDSEQGIIYNDSTINVDWQIPFEKMLLSPKDLAQKPLNKDLFYTTQQYNENI